MTCYRVRLVYRGLCGSEELEVVNLLQGDKLQGNTKGNSDPPLYTLRTLSLSLCVRESYSISQEVREKPTAALPFLFGVPASKASSYTHTHR